MTEKYNSSNPKVETIKWNSQVSLCLIELIDSSHGIKQCDTEEKNNRKRDKVCKSQAKQ